MFNLGRMKNEQFLAAFGAKGLVFWWLLNAYLYNENCSACKNTGAAGAVGALTGESVGVCANV